MDHQNQLNCTNNRTLKLSGQTKLIMGAKKYTISVVYALDHIMVPFTSFSSLLTVEGIRGEFIGFCIGLHMTYERPSMKTMKDAFQVIFGNNTEE